MTWAADQDMWKTIAKYGGLVILVIVLIWIFVTSTTNVDVQDITAPEAFVIAHNNPDIVIIDCRANQSLYFVSHIPKAIWSVNPYDFIGTKNSQVCLPLVVQE